MKIIIHPGYCKTATTSLQKFLLVNHSQIISLGKPWNEKNSNFSRELKKHEGLYFNNKKTTSILNNLLNVGNKHKTVAVLSDETIHKDTAKVGWFAGRIKDLFPEAEILLTIRNQPSIIESYYMDSGRILKLQPKPFDNRFITFDAWLEWSWINWENSFLGLIDYQKSIEMYQNKFGIDKVHILLYEELLNDSEEYIKKLSAILGIDSDEAMGCLLGKNSNSQASHRSIKYAKLRESFFPNNLVDLIPFSNGLQKFVQQYISLGPNGKKQKIPNEWLNKINESYKNGNNVLVDKYNLPLKKYDYPL